MRYILLLLFIFTIIQAQSFSKRTLLGTWELSSSKTNATVAFGKYIGKKRNEVLILRFNPQGLLRLEQIGDVYNYEVIDGKLKIYETKVYRNNYQIKRKNRYDLFTVIGSVDGCLRVKVTKKKIPGYTSRNDLKMCKVSSYPNPIYQEDISKYRF